MPEAKTIARNTGFLFVSEVTLRILSLFLIIMMTRFLGEAGVGKYFFAVSYISIFQVFADFGITTLMFREISADKKNTAKYFNNVFTLKLILLSGMLFFSIVLFPLIYPTSIDILEIVILISIYFFFVGMISPFNILFNAFEKLEYYAVVTLVQTIFATILGIFLLLNGFGLVAVLYALISSYVVSFAVATFIAGKNFLRFKLEFDTEFWLYLIVKSFPFWMTGVFMIIYSTIDTLMLKFYRDYSVIGLYNISLKLVEALNFIPFVLIGAVFPAMTILHLNSGQLLSKLYNKTFYYMLVIALPVAFGTSMLAERIILFLYGPARIGSALALQILIWSAVLLFLNFLMGYLLNAIDKPYLFTIAAAISLIANVLLNFLLIPMFPSYEGAAFSLVISQMINFTILYLFALQSGYPADLQLAIRPFAAASIMALVLYFLPFLHLLILMPIGAIVYFLSLFIIGGIGRQEIELTRGLLKL